MPNMIEFSDEELERELKARKIKKWGELKKSAMKSWNGLTLEIVDFLVKDHTEACGNGSECIRCTLLDVLDKQDSPYMKQLNIMCYVSEVPSFEEWLKK